MTPTAMVLRAKIESAIHSNESAINDRAYNAPTIRLVLSGQGVDAVADRVLPFPIHGTTTQVTQLGRAPTSYWVTFFNWPVSESIR